MDPEALEDMLQVGTQSVEAYHAYLQGLALRRSAQETGERDEGRLAYEKFEEARRIDPGFSEAHSSASFFWQAQATPTMQGSNLTDASNTEIQQNYEERVDQAIATARTAIDRRVLEGEKALFKLRLRRAIGLFRSYLEERPNDIEAWIKLRDAAQYAGDIENQRWALQHLQELGKTQILAAQMHVAGAYQVYDPKLAAEYGLQALERWPDNYALLYQTHRTLMWARQPEKAAELAKRVDELFDFEPMVQARQACMEGRSDDVEAVIELVEGTERRNLIWLILKLQGKTQAAIDELKRHESEDFPQAIASWLTYNTFDPTPYPVLMEIVEREGIQRPPLAEPPYLCPPSR